MSRRLRLVRRPCAGLLAGCAAAALATPALAENGSGNSGTAFEAKVGAPADFAELDGPRSFTVDLFFGGRQVGTAEATTDRGVIRFTDPAAVAAAVPHVTDRAALASALTGPLESNAGRICSTLNAQDCGTLNPQVAGLIFDESRFRVDLFVAGSLLEAVAATPSGFLPAPDGGLSLAGSFGLALSGTAGSAPLYQFQTRSVASLGRGRLRGNAVIASEQGLLLDDLVVELDRPDQRWSAGLFWAPGSDFTGQRRVLGVGFGTQLDTRLDRQALEGTPLFLFLGQPARVELLVDGRLVDARLYDAGNNILDTTALPPGSYNLTLRIHEGGRPVREERRFFVRDAEMAPLGRPLFHAAAGLFANSRPGSPLSLESTLYARAGANVRLSRAFGVETAVTGSDGKLMGEAGVYLATRFARVRAVGLYSNDGDTGGLVQIASGDLGPVNFNLDLRKLHSTSGAPLLPIPVHAASFGGAAPDRAEAGGGSYTQLSGSAGLQLGSASLNLLGFYRREAGGAANYSVGPAVDWRLVQLPGMQLSLLADTQVAPGTLRSFVGARLLVSRGGLSMVSSGGAAVTRNDTGSTVRSVGSMSGSWGRRVGGSGEIAVQGGLDRGNGATTAQASLSGQSRWGSGRADLLHRFGEGSSYAVNLQSGGALTSGAMTLGGRELAESALIASVRGRGAAFELLVDGVPRGRVEAGGKLPLFLRPYRSYQVQLRPLSAGAIAFDATPRTVTLYPGNVEHEVWDAEPLVTVFGQLLDPAGRPVADARLAGRRELPATDGEGWFQLDVPATAVLEFVAADGRACRVALPARASTETYHSLGKVTCS